MDFDLQWLLIGLPIAFALGWLASRFDLRQLSRGSRDAPRAYFNGLSLLLNEQQDKAIDAFIEAIQADPDTAELHFALGSLFRRRGEFERAVRVHQHLLARGDLRPADRERAQLALAQDFGKAGLFDRAEDTWRALLPTRFRGEAQLALLSLHERARDWEKAAAVAADLESEGRGTFATRIAHHWCERAGEADARGDTAAADAAIGEAQRVAPAAPRPLVLAGARRARAGDHAGALATWGQLLERNSPAFMLVAGAYADSAKACGRTAAANAELLALHERAPSLDLLDALTKLGGETLPRLARHLESRPALSAAAQMLIHDPQQWPVGTLAALQRAVAQAAAPLQRYRCAACGFEGQHYYWQCPGCMSWDSTPTQRVEELQ
jgi:lipopolysaccharide biosynthesis regulator YciM